MEMPGLNIYSYTDETSKTVVAKNDNDTKISMADIFKNEVLNWKEKIKDKINEEIENDQEKNIKMSEKQWNALLEKVDIAINAHKEDIKTFEKADAKKDADVEDDEKIDCSAKTNDGDHDFLMMLLRDLTKKDPN